VILDLVFSHNNKKPPIPSPVEPRGNDTAGEGIGGCLVAIALLLTGFKPSHLAVTGLSYIIISESQPAAERVPAAGWVG
jgi:hypothetical protein